MKKLLLISLILAVCVCMLTSCIEETFDSLKNFMGNEASKDSAGSATGDSFTDQVNPGDQNSASTDDFFKAKETPLPKSPELPAGERISEDVLSEILTAQYDNFSCIMTRSVDGTEYKTLLLVESPAIYEESTFENGNFVERNTITQSKADIFYKLTLVAGADNVSISRIEPDEQDRFPIRDMPCAFSEFTFDEASGEYRANMVLEDGLQSGTVSLRFNSGKLVYACARENSDGQEQFVEMFLYDYGTTKTLYSFKIFTVTPGDDGYSATLTPGGTVNVGDGDKVIVIAPNGAGGNASTGNNYFVPDGQTATDGTQNIITQKP